MSNLTTVENPNNNNAQNIWEHYSDETSGLEFYRNVSTGEMRPTQNGLARMCGVTKSSIIKRANKVGAEEPNAVKLEIEVLIPYSVEGIEYQRKGYVCLYSEEFAADSIRYYAKQGRKQALKVDAALKKASIRIFAYEAFGIPYASANYQVEQSTPIVRLEDSKRTHDRMNNSFRQAIALCIDYQNEARAANGGKGLFVTGFKSKTRTGLWFADAYNIMYDAMFEGVSNCKQLKKVRGLYDLPKGTTVRDYFDVPELISNAALQRAVTTQVTNHITNAKNALKATGTITIVKIGNIIDNCVKVCIGMGVVEIHSPLLPEEFYNSVPVKTLKDAQKKQKRIDNGDKRIQRYIPQTNTVKTLEGLRKEFKKDRENRALSS